MTDTSVPKHLTLSPSDSLLKGTSIANAFWASILQQAMKATPPHPAEKPNSNLCLSLPEAWMR